MKVNVWKQHSKRLFSMLLVLVMVLTMMPPVHVHAAGPSLKITNAAGEETDTFEIGEPIFVTANSSDNDWVGFYTKGQADGKSYWFWYYVNGSDSGKSWVNGETYNIYDTVCYKNDYEGDVLPVGEYEIRLENNPTVSKNITLVDASSTAKSMTVESATIKAGESIKVTASNLEDYAWVGLYSGHVESKGDQKAQWFYYVNGHCGLPMEYQILSAGEYTLLMYNDYDGNSLEKYIHITVEEDAEAEPILTTDKTEYKFGEPIYVTTEYRASNAWVGLYKKGEPTDGSVVSIFWYYVEANLATVDITKTDATNGRLSEFVAGDYTAVLYKDGGYVAIGTADFTITTELDESKTETKDPTCEADGYVKKYNTDGTLFSEETKTALGHEWPEKWTFNEATRTHSKTCINNTMASCVMTGNCEFEVTDTKEATETENGYKVYTCSVCSGSYTEVVSKKEIDKIETITAPTCETIGKEKVIYTDGTFIERDVPALGHKWPEKWSPVEGTDTHEKVCANDTKRDHVLTEDCVFGEPVENNGVVTSTCTGCGREDSYTLLKINKSEFAYSANIKSDIQITVDEGFVTDQGWIGIYKKGEAYNPQAGGAYSIYWEYLKDLNSTFTVADLRDENSRSAEFVAGDYVAVLFGDETYDAVKATVEFKITKAEVSRETKEATCEEDGYVKVIYSDGTEETVSTTPKKNHAYPEKWTYNNDKQSHSKVCANDSKHVQTEKCTFVKTTNKEATATENGEDLYTCSVCEGSYTQETSIKEPVRTETIKEATCDEPGIDRNHYEDGSYIDVTVAALGHEYPEKWTYNNDKKTHSKVCANDPKHVLTENCDFTGVKDANDDVTYTCEVCEGTYTTALLSVEKTVFSLGEPVYVTAFCENDYSWVGLYNENDAYDPNGGGVVSEYWYYVVDSGAGVNRCGQPVNILDREFRQADPGAEGISEGNYKLVLFGDGGYTDILDTVYISFQGGGTEETEFTLEINGESCKNGDALQMKSDAPLKVVVDADGYVGMSWVALYNKMLGTDIDENVVKDASLAWEWIADVEGEELDWKSILGAQYIGEASIVVYGDGGYDDARIVVNLSFTKEIASETVIKAPTCTMPGESRVIYTDGTEATIFPDPLGHDFEGVKFTPVAGEKKHSATCKREGCGETVTADCEFDEGVITKEPQGVIAGEKTFTCEICGNTYTEPVAGEGPVGDTTAVRVGGVTRFETAMAAADELKTVLGVEKFDCVILANGYEFPDALAGSYLAAQKQAPLLLTNAAKASVVNKYICENVKAGGTVYILGGTKALPESVEAGLDGYNVKRLAGATRYETNLEILKEAGISGNTILVATGLDFADSLSASATGMPMLLVNKTLNKEQIAFVKENSDKTFVIIGGTKAVSEEVEVELQGYAAVTRIAGDTRYETSTLIAEKLIPNAVSAVVASAMQFPDGLCGGPLAYFKNAALLLVADGKTAVASEYMTGADIKGGIVLGGTSAIGDDTMKVLFPEKAE